MTPIGRVAAFGAAGIALVLVGGGAAYYLARWPADPGPGRGRVAATPAAPVSLPGERMLPDVAAAYDRSERQNRAEAEQKPGAGASVPPLDTLTPHDALPPPAARPGEAAAWERQRREQEKRQAQEQERAVKAKAQGMTQVLAAWGGLHQTVDAGLKPPEPERNEANPAAPDDPLANLPVDRVYYGLLRVYISSDEPGPVVVALQDGALNGARLIGSFKRADEKVVIHFDRMTFRGAWYAVDAVAIDPENGRLGLATAVDRRTVSRWAALLGSAVLQGAQRAYLSQGTQNSYLWGQTTTREFDDREILGIALGEIGTRTRQTATEYFNRPPTVTVDPALQLVGVLFLGPPSRKTDGPGSALASAAAPAATAEALRALARTVADPAGAAASRADPSASAQNDARPPALPALAPAAALPPTDNDRSERRWKTSPAWRPSPP